MRTEQLGGQGKQQMVALGAKLLPTNKAHRSARKKGCFTKIAGHTLGVFSWSKYGCLIK
jgi:hypothetical protein